MHRRFILGVVCLLLAACRSQEDTPLPTRIPDPTPTPEVTVSLPPTELPAATVTIAPTANFTPTLNLIQQTEVYLFGLRTAEAATATALAPTPPPIPEGGELGSGTLPDADWIAYEVTLTTADLAQMAQQVGMTDAAAALDGIFLWITWRSGSDDHLLVIRQDALEGTLLITPISYQRNGAVVDPAEAAGLIELYRSQILSRRRAGGVSYLDAIRFSAEGYTLQFLQSPE